MSSKKPHDILCIHTLAQNLLTLLHSAASHRIWDTNPEFVFRGTTYRYPGNGGSQEVPYTCTSANPYKAALFAAFCRNHYPLPVVYIAKTEQLRFPVLPEGSHCESEEEIAWKVAPLNFFSHTLGYITLDEMQDILRRNGFAIPATVSQPYISDMCDITPPMDARVIQIIVGEAMTIIKSP
jgi:hypothetical protein